MISSDAAVTRLAKSVGADAVLVVTLTGKSADRSTLTRNGTTTTVINHQLNGNWRLVNSASGEAVRGASFSDHVAQMDSNDPNQMITLTTSLLNELLDDSADFIPTLGRYYPSIGMKGPADSSVYG